MVNNTIAGELYVLFQCGASAPPTDDFPEGTKFFKVPLTSVSAPETVPYAFMVRTARAERTCNHTGGSYETRSSRAGSC